MFPHPIYIMVKITQNIISQNKDILHFKGRGIKLGIPLVYRRTMIKLNKKTNGDKNEC